MKPYKAVLEERSAHIPHDFDIWTVIWILENNETTYKVWHLFKFPFTEYIHKNSMGYRIKPL